MILIDKTIGLMRGSKVASISSFQMKASGGCPMESFNFTPGFSAMIQRWSQRLFGKPTSTPKLNNMASLPFLQRRKNQKKYDKDLLAASQITILRDSLGLPNLVKFQQNKWKRAWKLYQEEKLSSSLAWESERKLKT